jgi:sulfur carrier protein ThiS
MDIMIEFIGFPVIYDLFPEGPHAYSFPGKTILQLVEDLIGRQGRRLTEALLEPGGPEMDPTIQVSINGSFILKEEIPKQEIRKGDHVTFLKLLAGG